VFGRIDPLHEPAVAHRRVNGIDVFLGEARFTGPSCSRSAGMRSCLGNTAEQAASGVLYIHPALTEVVEQALLALETGGPRRTPLHRRRLGRRG